MTAMEGGLSGRIKLLTFFYLRPILWLMTNRWHLFGETGPWDEFHSYFELKIDALREAKKRLKAGYRVTLEDRETRLMSTYTLKEEKEKPK